MYKTRLSAISTALSLALGILSLMPRDMKAQSEQQAAAAPQFKVDPYWPKLLPDRWVIGEVGGVCVDAQDHVFTVNRDYLTPAEKITAKAAPPVTEFDADGNLVHSWGNRDELPGRLHGCFVDYENNIWIGGNEDAIVQKYTHDGSKMLLQIGTKKKFDTVDGNMGGYGGGSIFGAPTNSSRTLLNCPADVAVDPGNGDVYIADGYGNRRIVVFDKNGHFLRQWGRQGTVEEVDAGMGGVFMQVVHCVVIGHDGLVYVCDRLGGRVQVFDKMGNFKRNILIESKTARATGIGSACWLGFSPDPAQKFMIVGDCADSEIRILDRATGQALSGFGRPGNQVGEFGLTHSLAVNSKGDIIVGDSGNGRRIQMWRVVK